MDTLLTRLKNRGTVYKNSLIEAPTSFAMISLNGKDMLAVHGECMDMLEGNMEDGVKLCPLTHTNRLAINELFPFTAPTTISKGTLSLGLGDRLGIAGDAHLLALSGTNVRPVLAQQSLRELSLTHRTYSDVIDSAAWAVFRNGYRDGYAADGDHLKHKEDIKSALESGCSMITLDCSEQLQSHVDCIDISDIAARLSSPFPYGNDILMEVASRYLPAVNYCIEVYREIISKSKCDFEISLDETAYTTSPAAHYFVASMLTAANVHFTSIAPRFVGEFQKGIDYIGDTAEFAKDIEEHSRVAKQFSHKLSVHSGSDKFSILPFVNSATDGIFHLKTSGTSWLEAVKTIAIELPALYRKMHNCALAHFEESQAHYVVKASVQNITPLADTPDDKLIVYMQNDDSRQLLHITYGYILDEMGTEIKSALNTCRKTYLNTLAAHIRSHIDALRGTQ